MGSRSLGLTDWGNLTLTKMADRKELPSFAGPRYHLKPGILVLERVDNQPRDAVVVPQVGEK